MTRVQYFCAWKKPIQMIAGTSGGLLLDRTRTTIVFTLLGAHFIFAYQGVEVAVSGCVVSFLISYRHGAPTASGMSAQGSGLGSRRAGSCSSIRRIVSGRRLPFLSWPSALRAPAPHLARSEHHRGSGCSSHPGSVAWTSLPVFNGGVCEAVAKEDPASEFELCHGPGEQWRSSLPFMTGILAQRVGTMVLHPICLGLYAVVGVSWCSLPRISKRSV